jgi:DNA-binding MarR family transcriptional regulator
LGIVLQCLFLYFPNIPPTIDKTISNFDLEDRRKIHISLTKKGEDIYKHLVDFRMKVLQPIFEKLSPQEIETLKSILQKFKEEL